MNEGIRINKYLSEAGVCSRREADHWLEKGCISIDGKIAGKGDRVLPGQVVLYNGKLVENKEKEVILAFHKPKGIVCTTSKKDRNNIIDYIGYDARIYPVGRLDKDSEGLILLTNQGDLMDRILRGRNLHEKEYIVKVNHALTDSFLNGLREGVPIKELDAYTRPCTVTKLSEDTFRIILTQGLNRQIKRMCSYFGYRVIRLQRIRVLNIWLGDLDAGEYRELTEKEKSELRQILYPIHKPGRSKEGKTR